MSGMNRRLNALAKLYQRPAEEPPLWLVKLETEADQTAEQIALGRHVFARALRRYELEHGRHPLEHERDSPAFFERERRELDDLIRYQEALGVEAGWQAWLAEAEDWPEMLGRPNDAESYAQDVEYFTWSQERLRDSPALEAWRARTGWQPTEETTP